MSDDPDTTSTASIAKTTASSLRRSKRNKFHLDVAAIHHGRSRSPAILHHNFTVLQPMQPQPGPSTTVTMPILVKASPRNSPITAATTLPKQPQQLQLQEKVEDIIPKEEAEPEVIAPLNGPKKAAFKKSSAAAAAASNSREETATPESLGKRKRKAAVFDDFSYSIDSEDDAESHIIIKNSHVGINKYNNINTEITTTASTVADSNILTTIKSDNEYPCPRCPANFETRVGLTNHLKLHGANKTFPCHSCDFSCTNRKTMRQHKRVHGQSAPAKKRKSVDVKKPSPFNVDKILGNDGKKPKRTFPCPWCCYKTHTFARLIPHKLGHFRAHGYQCPNCTFRAESQSYLRSHLALHGKQALELWPPVYMTSESPDLPLIPVKIIRKSFHPERPLLSCNDCDFETRLRLRFERHCRKKHHLKTKSQKKKARRIKQSSKLLELLPKTLQLNCIIHRTCPYCGKRCLSEGHYRVHYALRHFSNQRMFRPSCQAMVNERFGKSEYLDSIHADNKNPSEFIGHVAALGPQSMIGELIAGLTIFTCPECPYKTNNKEKMNAHAQRHIEKSDYQCQICTYSCKAMESFNKHKQLHSTPLLPSLPIKAEDTPALPVPAKVLATVPAQPPTTTPGPVASGQSTTPSATPIQQQQSQSSKKPELSLRCPSCPYRSKHGCDMKAHQKMHSDRGTFRCMYCSYSTMRLNALKSHIALHDEDSGSITNEQASTPTPNQPMVQKLPEKDKESEFLPKEITTAKLWDDTHQQVMGRKMLKNNGSPFYRCSQCPFEAKYPSTLNQHFRYHNRNAKYKCPKCSFATDRDDILPKHIDSHQNEPPPGGYKCTACPYMADSYGKQWHHVQKHKKVGRFNCEICKFGVGSIQSYNDHMMLHGIVVGANGSPPIEQPQQPIVASSVITILPSTALKQTSVESATTTDISSMGTERRTPDATSLASTSSEKDKSEERSTTNSLPGIAIAQDFELDMDWSGASPNPPPPVLTSQTTTATRNNTESPLSLNGNGGPTTRGKYNKSPSKRTPLKQQFPPPMPQLNGPYKNNIQIELPPIPAAIRPKHKRQLSDSSLQQSSSRGEEEDDEKVHECKECPFTCLDSKMLKFHMRMHDGERPQKCAMCTFSCFNIDALYSHMNVHAPQLPETMLNVLKKKVAQRRRNGSLMERETISPNATNVFQCQQCSFKTTFQDRFLQHRMEHVQLLQQRLMTQMKRAANDDRDGRKSKIVNRKKVERKWNYCTQCSFRCDTLVALMNHQEYHGSRNNLFKCRYCDYSANNHDVVTYHENTHHMDLPATNQSLNFIAVNGIIDTDEVSEKRQKYKCTRCLYVCHELADYISHFEKNHIGEPEFEEIIQKLKMGLLPTFPLRSTLPQQSCHASIAQEQQQGSSGVGSTAVVLSAAEATL